MADEEIVEEQVEEVNVEDEAGGSLISRLLGSKLMMPVILILGMGAGMGGAMMFMKPEVQQIPVDQVTVDAAQTQAVQEETEKKPPNVPDIEKIDVTPQTATSQFDDNVEFTEQEMVKFDPMVVNIFEKNSIHYLKLQIEFTVSSLDVIEEIRIKKALLRDRLLFIFSDTTLREILSTGGKAILKEDITAAFNRILKKGKIKKMFFTDFTVQ